MDDLAVLTAMIAVCDWLERALGLRTPAPRSTCYKEAFKSMGAGERIASKIFQRKHYRLRVYKCAHCGHYHLTSASNMKSNKMKNVTSRNMVLQEKRIIHGKNKSTFR